MNISDNDDEISRDITSQNRDKGKANKKNGKKGNDTVIDIPNDFPSSTNQEYEDGMEGKKKSKGFFKKTFSKLANIFAPIRKSRKLKKLKKKIVEETIDPEHLVPRVQAIDPVPFFFFGHVKEHQIYQLYKYVEITNLVRNSEFMEKWIVDTHLRKICYQAIEEMNDEYLLSGQQIYNDNVRPSYRDKDFAVLKSKVRDLAPIAEISCGYGQLIFSDAVWDCLGCMVFKQFMGLDVRSPLVCHIDHIFPFSRIKGGASELQNLCVLNQFANGFGRKGKSHLFELFTDQDVNDLLENCLRRSTITQFFNTFQKEKEANRKKPRGRKPNNNSNSTQRMKENQLRMDLEEATQQFLTKNGIAAKHIAEIKVEPNLSTSTHTIHVRFISNPK